MYLIKSLGDTERAKEIFVSAFTNSLGVNWILNRPTDAAKELTVNVLLYEGLDKSGAFLSEDRNGAVLFYDTNHKGGSFRNILRKAHLVLRYAGVRNTYKAVLYRRMIASIRPKNVMVGFLVATDKEAKGTKAVYEIHRDMIALASSQNKPIALETTSPRVRRLYAFAGYEEYAEVKHPYADLTIWFFIKRA